MQPLTNKEPATREVFIFSSIQTLSLLPLILSLSIATHSLSLSLLILSHNSFSLSITLSHSLTLKRGRDGEGERCKNCRLQKSECISLVCIVRHSHSNRCGDICDKKDVIGRERKTQISCLGADTQTAKMKKKKLLQENAVPVLWSVVVIPTEESLQLPTVSSTHT